MIEGFVMRRLAFVAFASLVSLIASTTCAQRYPNRPIRFVVGFAPGGSADVVARAVMAQLQRQMGTIVLDNRPGAGGVIGYDLVAKAEPDGDPVLCISTSFVASVAASPQLPFDAQKDYIPVTLFAMG